MEKFDTDVVIIGAGVIGLSIAYFFSKNKKKVILLEKERNFGLGVSSRNTEVIHAGIYYPTGSMKSKLCLRGKEMIYDFCQKYQINHKKIGKLLFGTTLLYGLGVIIMGYTNTLLIAFLIAIFIGGSQSVFRTCISSTIVDITEEKYRGRMISMTMLDMGMASVASIIAGRITDVLDITYGMLFCGAFCIIIGLITFISHKKLFKI